MRVLYAQAVYGREEIDAVTTVLENSPEALMTGTNVLEFESRVSALFGKPHGLMVTSGSAANMLAVAALGLEPGAEVITPALTFSTTVAPLVQNGLVPAFVDVEADTFCIDATRVREMITPKTKAMMVPNLIGNLAEWANLREIADEFGLKLIEDSCDTIGYRYRGGSTGQLSDVVTTSFYASHIITAGGFGGMVCFNDETMERRARILRGWGRASTLLGERENPEDRFDVEVDGIPYDAKFTFGAIGYNFLPSEMSASFGLQQLNRLDAYFARRKSNFEKVVAVFKAYPDWFLPPRQTAATETAWLAVPLIVRDAAPFTRRDLQIHFETNQIQTRTVFTGNILRQPGFKDIAHKSLPGGYPNADQVMRGGVLLGCHQGMGDAEIEYMAQTLEAFAAKF